MVLFQSTVTLRSTELRGVSLVRKPHAPNPKTFRSLFSPARPFQTSNFVLAEL